MERLLKRSDHGEDACQCPQNIIVTVLGDRDDKLLEVFRVNMSIGERILAAYPGPADLKRC